MSKKCCFGLIEGGLIKNKNFKVKKKMNTTHSGERDRGI